MMETATAPWLLIRWCCIILILWSSVAVLAEDSVSYVAASEPMVEEFGIDYITSGDESSKTSDEADEEATGADLNPEDNPGYGEKQMAYTLRMGLGEGGCTAVLIHKDWILSAYHCFQDKYKESYEDDNGDLVLDLEKDIRSLGGGSKEKLKYTKPLKLKRVKKGDEADWKVWRKVKRFYVLPYEGERKLYKGEDLVLGRLSKKVHNPVSKYLAPVCLPDPDKPDLKADFSDKLFYAGKGRRRIPHCITDINGPEQAGLCARPKLCTEVHKTRQCGLEFLYKGKLHNKCITDKTPSAADPICQKLLAHIKAEKNKTKKIDFTKKTFVFKADGNLQTTCYPTTIKPGRKGWCTTRNPWEDENKEPKPDSGWGFCGEEDYQKNCSSETEIEDVLDTRLMQVSQITDDFCIRQLKKNIEKELPGVPEEDYNDLGKSKLICTGKNVTWKNTDFQAWGYFNKTFVSIEIEKIIQLLHNESKSGSLLHTIQGSGSCFGDSGGPLVKYEGDKPVLVGVMSFLLWGTCRSRFEPTFYTRIKDRLGFIFKHVPKDELCFG